MSSGPQTTYTEALETSVRPTSYTMNLGNNSSDTEHEKANDLPVEEMGTTPIVDKMTERRLMRKLDRYMLDGAEQGVLVCHKHALITRQFAQNRIFC